MCDVNETDMVIAKNLRLARLSNAMTLKNLAAIVGVSYQQLQKYEQGKNRIAASRLYELSRILNCDIQFFYRP